MQLCSLENLIMFITNTSKYISRIQGCVCSILENTSRLNEPEKEQEAAWKIYFTLKLQFTEDETLSGSVRASSAADSDRTIDQADTWTFASLLSIRAAFHRVRGGETENPLRHLTTVKDSVSHNQLEMWEHDFCSPRTLQHFKVFTLITFWKSAIFWGQTWLFRR